MQDGDSIKGKDEAKRETIEQAHLLRDTRKHVFLVSNSFHARIYNERKETKARIQCRATTEYDLLTGTLIQFYFTRRAPHSHKFTQNPKEMEVATSLSVESFLCDRNSEPLRRGPRARAARRTCGLPDSTDGVFGKRTWSSGAFSALAHGIQGSREDRGLGRNNKLARIKRLAQGTGTTRRRPNRNNKPDFAGTRSRTKRRTRKRTRKRTANPPRPPLL